MNARAQEHVAALPIKVAEGALGSDPHSLGAGAADRRRPEVPSNGHVTGAGQRCSRVSVGVDRCRGIRVVLWPVALGQFASIDDASRAAVVLWRVRRGVVPSMDVSFSVALHSCRIAWVLCGDS